MASLALLDPARPQPSRYYGGYTDPERPTWKLRALMLGVMDERMERELDRIDRFLKRLKYIHSACPSAHKGSR